MQNKYYRHDSRAVRFVNIRNILFGEIVCNVFFALCERRELQ